MRNYAILSYMKYWLMKIEPDVYPWEQLVKEKKTAWTGVRNYAARNHMRAMKKGDRVLYYYSMAKEMGVVGIAEVIKEAYVDNTADEPIWSCVDIKPVEKLKRFVPLSEIKQTPALKQMVLLRISRLSVQPVTTAEYKTILKLGSK